MKSIEKIWEWTECTEWTEWTEWSQTLDEIIRKNFGMDRVHRVDRVVTNSK